MRCRSCDCILTDEEAVLKDRWKNYIDMCFSCISGTYLHEVRDGDISEILEDEESSFRTT